MDTKFQMDDRFHQMDIITSTKNQYVKEAKSLHDKKFRQKTGLFLVEGINLLMDMPDSVDVEYVFLTEKRLAETQNLLACTRARVYCISESIADYISDTVSAYGIIAICKIPDQKFEYPRKNAILLDGVSDPGNLGTILRSAAATDFLDVYLLNSADLYSPKVVRSTLGALFKVRCMEICESEALELLSKCNSAALDMNGKDLTKEKIASPILFVAGSEAHGVSEQLMKNTKTTYSLPMKNNIESLNVAVASSIAMYQTI